MTESLGFATYIRDFTVSMDANPIDVTEIGDFVRKYIPGQRRTEGSFSILVPNESFDVAYSFIDTLAGRLSWGSYQRFIGSGTMCNHCKTVYARGVLYCTQCGSYDLTMTGRLEMESEAVLTAYHIEPAYDWISVQMDVYFPEGFKWTPAFDWRRDSLLTLFGSPTHWLCQRCGLFVDRDLITCPGCGGNRLSANEISSLNRQCIYCLRPVKGGFACPDCDGRLRPLLN